MAIVLWLISFAVVMSAVFHNSHCMVIIWQQNEVQQNALLTAPQKPILTSFFRQRIVTCQWCVFHLLWQNHCKICVFLQIVGLVLISLAAGGYALSHIADMRIMGGLIACGVFLLIIAIAGLVGTALHHQVTLFFVSLQLGLMLLFWHAWC